MGPARPPAYRRAEDPAAPLRRGEREWRRFGKRLVGRAQMRLPSKFREQSRLFLPSPARIAAQSWRGLPTWWGGVSSPSQPLEQCLPPRPVALLAETAGRRVFPLVGLV